MGHTRKKLKLPIMDRVIKKFFSILNLKIKGIKFLIDSIEVPEITKILKKTLKKYSENIKINFYDK